MKKRIISLLVIAMLILSIVPAAFAASVPQYFIDTAKTASLNIYKIDFTNAYKDGVWTEDSFVSTGWRESYVEDTLINEPSRKGTSSNAWKFIATMCAPQGKDKEPPIIRYMKLRNGQIRDASHTFTI